MKALALITMVLLAGCVPHVRHNYGIDPFVIAQTSHHVTVQTVYLSPLANTPDRLHADIPAHNSDVPATGFQFTFEMSDRSQTAQVTNATISISRNGGPLRPCGTIYHRLSRPGSHVSYLYAALEGPEFHDSDGRLRGGDYTLSAEYNIERDHCRWVTNVTYRHQRSHHIWTIHELDKIGK